MTKVKWFAQILTIGILALAARPSGAADSVVTFNEIMYNPSVSDPRMEWIELHNSLACAVDLSSWSLRGGIDYVFADGTSITAEGYLIVAIEPEAFVHETLYNPALGPFSGTLGNGGEDLRLENNAGRIMDEFTYDDEGDWPVAPDGSGVSLAKIEPMSASAEAKNWTWSRHLGGTPGQPNLSPLGPDFATLVAAQADALAYVPQGDYLGTSWTLPDFNHWNWQVGKTGVGYETRLELAINYSSLARLDVRDAMFDKNKTCYIRVPFYVTEPDLFSTLTLRMQYDAGFVAYINGVEVARANVGLGPLTWNSGARKAHFGKDAIAFENFDASAGAGHLRAGRNVLAIHALNDEIDSIDFLMMPELYGQVAAQGGSAVLSEMASTSSDPFWIEVANPGPGSVDLTGYVLSCMGQVSGEYLFPSGTLAPGAFTTVDATALGFSPEPSDRIFLHTPHRGLLLDARQASNRLRGLAPGNSPDDPPRWLYPPQATPGTQNRFEFEDAIVINEILYHARPQGESREMPAVYENASLVAIDASWKYDASGDDLAAAWREPDYGDAAWSRGQSVLGDSLGVMPAPIRTTITPGGQTTFYFRTEFDFEGSLEGAQLQINALVDDGAVVYLNGAEILRVNMPDGPIDYLTTAKESVRFATFTGPIVIPADALRAGRNVLAAEVHQFNSTSTDVIFGVALQTSMVVEPAIPAKPFVENPEEWIELYNRSGATVDLSGWSIADAIDFTFPSGTSLAPDAYLVVANDVEALGARLAGVEVLGDFRRNLSNRTDRILLLDAHGNPADDVTYFDGKPWPYEGDGQGASLELRDPRADNSKPEAWQASDEAARSEWQTISYRGLATQVEGPSVWQELVIGLLDAGEVLLDDISVVEDPNGAAIQRVKVGGFETEYAPKVWRFNGTHRHSSVIEDPDDPGNHVMHVVATAATVPNYNNIETTLTDGIRDYLEYEISVRARWLSGSNQLNLRLYHNRLQRTILLDTPPGHGTPGAPNSRYAENIGPTFHGLTHAPVVPLKTDSVTVSVLAEDPDGMTSCTLHWAIEGRWTSGTAVAMRHEGDGRYAAEIPPAPFNTIVQFYVEATDGAGATAFYPPDGPDSRALYQVLGDAPLPGGLQALRLIMTTLDADTMFTPNKRMSNDLWGATLIDRERIVYYDVGVRQKGGAYARPNNLYGYRIRLHNDHLYRGAHEAIGVDRSMDLGEMFREQCGKHLFRRVALPGMHDNLIHFLAPRPVYRTATLMMASYDNEFLEGQWPNGGDGSVYNFDLQYIPTGTENGDPEGLKITNPYTHDNGQIDLQDLGDDKESYRWWFLIKNNRLRDDFSGLMAFLKSMSLPTDQLAAGIENTMDVGEWLRFFGMINLCGMSDMYTESWNHNLRIYVRPSDQRAEALPWDLDGTFARATDSQPWSLATETNMRRVIELPSSRRVYYRHLSDMIATGFNREYMAPWVREYAKVLGVANPAAQSDYVKARADYIAARIPSKPDGPTFAITSETPLTTTRTVAQISGSAWIDVDRVYLEGRNEPLPLTWTFTGSGAGEKYFWHAEVPVDLGKTELTFQAYGYDTAEGRPLIASETIAVERIEVKEPLPPVGSWVLY